MSKRRLSSSEIKKVIQEYKNGTPIPQILKTYGISQATFYNWKAKYENPSASDMIKLQKLEADHNRLKGMFADLSIENQSLKTQLKELREKLKKFEQIN